ncbi:hypothetical protein [Xylanimonas cellulosilytica]|uniref:hypothetical protein n=1 Tax=Xylanimonas cellulosilytica TaxID=186189 RepID=UPI00019BFB7D|nr:hypothetical protein [Xylanimonas cellulosilytica]
MTHLTSATEAVALAARLTDPGRSWPVVVISTPAGSVRPHVDADAVLREVTGWAEVVVVPTGSVSWAFSDAMPPHTQVYGGASRVYPVGIAWVDDVRRSRLRFAYSAEEGGRVQGPLVHDALAAAAGAGLASSGQTDADRMVGGTVRLLTTARALIALDDGTQAAVAEELTLPGVPVERLLRPGMRVTGSLDPGTRLLDITGMVPARDERLRMVHASYRPGTVVLGRVVAVEEEAVTIAVAPDVEAHVRRAQVTGNELDRLTDLFTIGEVVAARVVPSPGVSLRLDDVDDVADEIVPAIALLPDGPPWLDATPAPRAEHSARPEPAGPTTTEPGGPTTERAGPTTAEAAGPTTEPGRPNPRPGPRPRPTPADLRARRTPPPVPAAPSSSDAPAVHAHGAARDLSLSLDAERALTRRLTQRAEAAERRAVEFEAEVIGLRRELARMADEQRTHEAKAGELRTRLRESKNVARRAVAAAADAQAPQAEFLDPVDQFRHDVYLTWAVEVPATDKPERPLGDYDLGPHFLESLDQLQGVPRERVLTVVVWVLTGQARHVNGLQLHRLRTGTGGDDPVRVRESDNATAWRVSLQVDTPSARRLHFWQRTDGRVELARVGLHDDFSI